MSLILTRAPLRVSFFGGGSDYLEWFKREPGAVLSTAIDKYVYISCRYRPPFFPGTKHRIVWRHVELTDSIPEILHPAVRHGLLYLGFDEKRGLELHYQGDLPSGSGLGSSSSFVVSMLHALMCLQGREFDKRELAEIAIDLERNHMGESVGSQDQVASVYGGLNLIRFYTDGSFDVSPLGLSAERESELVRCLMLIYPGHSRIGVPVARSVIKNLKARAATIRQMVAMVDEGAEILRSGDLDDFGRLLHEAWMHKRALSDCMSSEHIDDLYDRARRAGALGGKLLGAGKTGFILLYAPPDRQEVVRAAVTPQCHHVPFGFDHQGSCIIYQTGDVQEYQW